MRSRRAGSMGAALRSMLIPGWGQLVTRQRRTGNVLVFLSGLMVIAALTVFLFVEPIEMAAWLADPDVILGIILCNVVLLIVRLLSTEMAWKAGGGHRWVVGLSLAVIVAIPHVAIGWAGVEARRSMMRLFPPETAAATATTTLAISSTTTSTVTSITVTLVAGHPPSTTRFSNPLPDSPAETGGAPEYVQRALERHPFGSDRLNILLLGGDAGPHRTGLRTDTMIIASVDPISGDTALIGVPRNFGGMTLSDGTSLPVTQLGHVYAWGTDHPERFGGPDPGAAATLDVISNLTDLDIEYFVLVDLTGFADVVDVFGGVKLDVPTPVDGPLYDVATGGYDMVRIPSGLQHLDGAHALAYARARHGSSDYVRMARQRCILASMAAQADVFDLLTRLGNLLDAVEANVVTDIPIEMVPDLIRLVPRVTAGNVRMIGFDSTWGVGVTASGRTIPDMARIQAAVRTVIENPGSGADIGVTTADAGC